MIHAFPKIFTVGTDYIRDLFNEDVEITEKIDGSQFVFGKVNGELYMRSKGKEIIADAPDKMFSLAVDYVLSIKEKIPNNTVFYCEYLKSPRHNVLAYKRTPTNNLILFGVSSEGGTFISEYYNLTSFAKMVDVEVVPLLFKGRVEDKISLLSLLETESVLGGTKIEGFVVKNYSRPFLLGGQPIPLMAGKFVSEKFKEKHKTNWGKEHTDKGKWELFIESYRTEARWLKSIQHLRDNGELENAPKDIGKLLIAIRKDIEEEEKEEIKNFLWSCFKDGLLRKAVAGFPEWYKEKLLDNSFKKEVPNEEG